MPRRAAGDTRDRLLDAAARLLLRDPSKLTLDAVAEEAGVSKGGLLYHFSSKGQLLDAVVDRWEASFQAQIDAAADPAPGGWTRAYADMTAKDGEMDAHAREVDSGILAVLALQPERLDAVRARYEGWQERVEADGIDPVDATIVRLAADGLWFTELLGLGPPRGELRERVLERLRALTRA
ncbi:MAG TPA: TetR/AcrR family transcriptional regulator [Baekduia sp.]|nr:TetR/AcrR family transcriptional regulator [Baekduia sp.]